ncbi:MAG: hypothetical protein K6G68_10305 [Oscillospiraceae bacterium]|nr:hypothetical protein [Oscillospiraceae bacterium]
MNELISMVLSVIFAVMLSGCGNTQPATDKAEQYDHTVTTEQKQTTQSKKDTVTEDRKAVSDTVKADNTNSDNSDTLIVYFSRTGNTEKIAAHLTELTGADTYVITAAVPYTDEDIEYNNDNCRANKEQNDKSIRPEIADKLSSIDDYDTIFLGYPIWWGQEPRIIDTFLESYDFSEKTVIPFCTSGSSGIETSERNIAELTDIGDLVKGKRFAAGASKEDVKEWYDMLPIGNKSNENKITLSVNGNTLSVTLADTDAAKELSQKLKDGAVTIDLKEYGGFEKVGALPWSLTTSDENTETKPGDIMLYQGDQITIFYGSNTWSYTKLGTIDDVTADELEKFLSGKSITVTLS